MQGLAFDAEGNFENWWTAADAKGLLKAAIRDDDPVLFFEHKFLYRNPKIKQEIPADDYIVPIGKAAVRREGSGVDPQPGLLVLTRHELPDGHAVGHLDPPRLHTQPMIRAGGGRPDRVGKAP